MCETYYLFLVPPFLLTLSSMREKNIASTIGNTRENKFINVLEGIFICIGVTKVSPHLLGYIGWGKNKKTGKRFLSPTTSER